MIRRFTEDGLQGVETYYTENRPVDTRYLEALSEKYRLIRTGGSDYHGKNKPNHHMLRPWKPGGDHESDSGQLVEISII